MTRLVAKLLVFLPVFPKAVLLYQEKSIRKVIPFFLTSSLIINAITLRLLPT